MAVLLPTKLKKSFTGTAKVKKIYYGSIQIWVSTQQITVPTQAGTLTYSGSSQTPSWNNYDSTKMTIGGTTSGTNANTYSATFTPKEGYSWDADGDDVSTKTVSWTIGKKSISGATITLGTTPTYTGSTVTQSVSSVVIGGLTATYSVSGNTGINAGSYTLTCTGTGNFSGTQTKAWSVAKATPTITLSPTSLTLTGAAGTRGFVIVSSQENGTVSASSSATEKATVSVTPVNHVYNGKNFTSTSGWSANQNVALSVSNSMLHCVSNQDTSTPGALYNFVTSNFSDSVAVTLKIKGSGFSGIKVYVTYTDGTSATIYTSNISSSITTHSFSWNTGGKTSKAIYVLMSDPTVGGYFDIQEISTVEQRVYCTSVASGSATITVTVAQTTNYNSKSATFTCTTKTTAGVTRSATATLSSVKGTVGSHIGDYALFAHGGSYNENFSKTIDVFNESMTNSTIQDDATGIPERRNSIGAYNDNYAIFGGGYISSGGSLDNTIKVSAFNSSLTKSVFSDLAYNFEVGANNGRRYYINGYAIIGMTTYNASGTRGTISSGDFDCYYDARGDLAGDVLVTNQIKTMDSNYYDTYYMVIMNSSLSVTKTSVTSSNAARGGAASTGSYMVCGGGDRFVQDRWTGSFVSSVYAYNSSATRTSVDSLSVARVLIGTSVGSNGHSKYAILADGGIEGNGDGSPASYTNADGYNDSLTHTTLTATTSRGLYVGATPFGNDSCIFAGGRAINSYSAGRADYNGVSKYTLSWS